MYEIFVNAKTKYMSIPNIKVGSKDIQFRQVPFYLQSIEL